MKKVFLLAVVLTSCGQERKEVWKEHKEIIIVKDSVYIDSLVKKATDLIISTQNSYKKVERIKQISNENIALKKELKQTKEELKGIKDSLEVKNKKTFIQKVISTFKKDSI